MRVSDCRGMGVASLLTWPVPIDAHPLIEQYKPFPILFGAEAQPKLLTQVMSFGVM